MSFGFSRRADLVEPFLAMEVMERAFALEREGREILHLEIGEPDFPPPPAAVEACQSALMAGETRYTDSRGMVELREAIAASQRRRTGVEVDPEQILVTSGTSPAMLLVFLLLVEPGGEVILGTPHYPCYPNFVHVAGGTPVYVETHAEEGYRLDPERVRERINERTRAIVVASPANPTGAIQDGETLRALARLGPALVSDEIYDGLVYEGASVSSALGLSEDVFLLDGFSKRYAMTGFRLGYLIAPPRTIRPLQTLAQSLFISAGHFVQRAGIAALESGSETVERMREAYDRRRRLLLEGLREIGFEVSTAPRGAFYIFAGAQRFGRDSKQLAFEILEQAGVAVTPGVDFGAAGEGFLRFSYAASDDSIQRALEAIRDWARTRNS
jgi:aspartate/methionine/tyrosine aminotransferase